MTPSVIKLPVTPEDHRIARLAAAAIGLSLIDAAIPMPLPGIKPGLANIITLIVLARSGRNVPIPFGPYLATAGLIAFFWGKALTQIYLRLI